jgi:hypothetical protein
MKQTLNAPAAAARTQLDERYVMGSGLEGRRIDIFNLRSPTLFIEAETNEG